MVCFPYSKCNTKSYCRVKLNLSHAVETQDVASLHWKKAGTSPATTMNVAATLVVAC